MVSMLSPDDPIFYTFTSREILLCAVMPIVFFSIIAYRYWKYKYLDWLSLSLAILLLSMLPLLAIVMWFLP
jgi:hypothetical protein